MAERGERRLVQDVVDVAVELAGDRSADLGMAFEQVFDRGLSEAQQVAVGDGLEAERVAPAGQAGEPSDVPAMEIRHRKASPVRGLERHPDQPGGDEEQWWAIEQATPRQLGTDRLGEHLVSEPVRQPGQRAPPESGLYVFVGERFGPALGFGHATCSLTACSLALWSSFGRSGANLERSAPGSSSSLSARSEPPGTAGVCRADTVISSFAPLRQLRL